MTDYGQKFLLREIRVNLISHTWEWIKMEGNALIEVNDQKFCDFNVSINRSVNDLYCTVYEFNSYKEMCDNWDNIKYVDSIKTVYEEKK